MTGVNIVGVQFRRAGKIYNFNAKKFCVAQGDCVVVETDRGPSMAEVMRVSFTAEAEVDLDSLKPVLRVASKKDQAIVGKLTEAEALKFTNDRIHQLKLEMSVIGVDVQLGGSKIIVYFTAPGRVDFRELVKELATGLKTRVELKQVGSRDEAKLVGGLGICGREFCCSSFLREFVPVSIKMAKNQNLALNPSKVSGGCGRLLCCLTYEDDTYSELRQKLPPRKSQVRGPDGQTGIVIKSDILNQRIVIETSTGEQVTLAVSEIEVLAASEGEDLSEQDDWGDDLDLSQLMDKSDKSDKSKQMNDRPVSRPVQRTKPFRGDEAKGSRAPEARRPRPDGDNKPRGDGPRPEGEQPRKRRRSRNRNKNKGQNPPKPNP